MINYGDILKHQREIAGLNQHELAKAIETSQANISRWENNEAIPNLDFCIRLAQFYNITLDELVGLSDEATAPTTMTQKHDTAIEQSEDEIILLDAYRQMSDGKKQALFQMLDLNISAIKTKRTKQ